MEAVPITKRGVDYEIIRYSARRYAGRGSREAAFICTPQSARWRLSNLARHSVDGENKSHALTRARFYLDTYLAHSCY